MRTAAPAPQGRACPCVPRPLLALGQGDITCGSGQTLPQATSFLLAPLPTPPTVTILYVPRCAMPSPRALQGDSAPLLFPGGGLRHLGRRGGVGGTEPGGTGVSSRPRPCTGRRVCGGTCLELGVGQPCGRAPKTFAPPTSRPSSEEG